MRHILFASALVVLCFSAAAASGPEVGMPSDPTQIGRGATSIDSGMVCSKETGFNSRPVVPTERAAKEIYITIARALFPRSWRKYPDIFVLDEGEKWSVGQRVETAYKTFKDKNGVEMESTTVQAGGGALEMEIDKCSAVVTVHFAR